MSTPCIFCDNNSGSREHLWPAWMHAIKDFGPIKMERRGQETVVMPDPEHKVKTVCGKCNNGWMSDLEGEAKPALSRLFGNVRTTLQQGHMKAIAEWSVKTAMISDSMKGRNAPNKFYTRDECTAMREKREIPARTLIWTGGSNESHLACVGNDFTLLTPEGNRFVSASAVTIAVGHLITQVVTVHLEDPTRTIDSIPCKFGNWADKLHQIWPNEKMFVNWPPDGEFTNGGPEGIAYLMDRWRIGEEVNMIPTAGKTI